MMLFTVVASIPVLLITSVRVGPGLTIFTLIFLGASSAAAVLAIEFNAALLAWYTELFGLYVAATMDERITTDAPSGNSGINLLKVKYAPLKLIPITLSKFVSLMFSIRPNEP